MEEKKEVRAEKFTDETYVELLRYSPDDVREHNDPKSEPYTRADRIGIAISIQQLARVALGMPMLETETMYNRRMARERHEQKLREMFYK